MCPALYPRFPGNSHLELEVDVPHINFRNSSALRRMSTLCCVALQFCNRCRLQVQVEYVALFGWFPAEYSVRFQTVNKPRNVRFG
jgi:hypothetical protein